MSESIQQQLSYHLWMVMSDSFSEQAIGELIRIFEFNGFLLYFKQKLLWVILIVMPLNLSYLVLQLVIYNILHRYGE